MRGSRKGNHNNNIVYIQWLSAFQSISFSHRWLWCTHDARNFRVWCINVMPEYIVVCVCVCIFGFHCVHMYWILAGVLLVCVRGMAFFLVGFSFFRHIIHTPVFVVIEYILRGGKICVYVSFNSIDKRTYIYIYVWWICWSNSNIWQSQKH